MNPLRFSSFAGVVSVLFIAGAVSCSKTPLEKYKALIQKKESGKKVNEETLTRAYLSAFSTAQFSRKQSFIGKNIVLGEKEGKPHVIYPMSIPLQDSKLTLKDFTFGAINENFIVLGNEKEVKVFNIKGEPHLSHVTKGSGMKAMDLYQKSLVFIEDKKLFKLHMGNGTCVQIGSEAFLPPYKGYYLRKIMINEGIVGVCLGVAGMHYLSLIDLDRGKTLMKNILVSSQAFYLNDQKVYCIKGGSGNWQLYCYDPNTKKKEKIKSIKSVSSFSFNEDFIIIKDKKEPEIYDYSNRRINPEVPLNFERTLPQVLILRHGDRRYVLPNSVLTQNEKTQ